MEGFKHHIVNLVHAAPVSYKHIDKENPEQWTLILSIIRGL